MKISVTNTKKLEAAIQAAEGSKSTAWTISARDVAVALEEIEKTLRTLMPKKIGWTHSLMWMFTEGISLSVIPASHTARSSTSSAFPMDGLSPQLGRSATKRYNQRIEPVNLDMDAVTKTIKDSKFWS